MAGRPDTTESTPQLARAAVRYAAAGYAVFPLRPHHKVPATPRGFKDATCDVEQVRAWWTENPNRNIGIRTGDGLTVVDLDGDDGCEAFRELQRRHGPCGSPWWVETAKGWHAWYSTSEDVPSSVGRVAPRIDVRGSGGYVVSPPSIHPSGHVYRWWEPAGDAPGELPGWLRGLASHTPQPIVARSRARKGTRWARAVLQGELDEVAATPKGGRNDRLNRAAFWLGRLVGAGLLDGREVADGLLTAALRAGLGGREAVRTITSGMNAGIAVPLEVSA